jgi:hypothetical protein
LVFPTQSPLFWLVQNFHQQRFLPISIGLGYQAPRGKPATHQARHHGLPILATCANTLRAKDTMVANHSIVRRCAIPIIFLQNSGDWKSFVGLLEIKDLVLQEMEQSFPIACLSIHFLIVSQSSGSPPLLSLTPCYQFIFVT